MYRGILMPFSSDDDNIDFIYGVINWKEVADEAETNAIISEVEQALQTTPVRHDRPVNVWADGPSGVAPVVAPGFDAMAPHDADESIAEFEPDGSKTLWDWLAARETADAATSGSLAAASFPIVPLACL
jgi:hypothetical protein